MTKHEAILGRQEVATLMTEIVVNDELAAANDLVGWSWSPWYRSIQPTLQTRIGRC